MIETKVPKGKNDYDALEFRRVKIEPFRSGYPVESAWAIEMRLVSFVWLILLMFLAGWLLHG